MSNKNILEIEIKPKILRWARESIGFTMSEVAARLKLAPDIVRFWESGEKPVPLGRLEFLANYYKRPLATFFLPKVPIEPAFPTDFRTLPDSEDEGLSKKTRVAVRKAQRLQLLASELNLEQENKTDTKIGSSTLNSNPEELAIKVRKKIGVSLGKQFKWSDDYIALRVWIKAIEGLGVLVFQMSMPLKEIRGFSLIGLGKERNLPAIIINTQDSVRGRIFTLFHEYCHLLLNNSGICDLRDRNNDNGKLVHIEKFCNHFAGAILVPGDSLLEQGELRQITELKNEGDYILRRVSNLYKASKEVILRRLLILGERSQSLGDLINQALSHFL